MRSAWRRLTWVSGALLTGCLVVPLQPDRQEWATRVPPPDAPGADMQVVPLLVGSQWAPRCVAAGQASCISGAQTVYVAYLVRHPRATFLIDAALSQHGRADVKRLPTLGRLAFRYHSTGGLGAALAAAGAPPVDFVLLTHAHWDHAGGLDELVRPRVVLGPGEAERIARISPGEASPFIPADFKGAALETFAWDGPPYETFPRSHDWFGDGSVVLVPLPGHTPGSIGVFLRSVGRHRLFFVGDAAWSMDGIELPSHKSAPFSHLTDDDPTQLSETLWRLHHLRQMEPDLLMVPAHDARALEQIIDLNR
jgi:N-acyl homoserine lactone hydrolase